MKVIPGTTKTAPVVQLAPGNTKYGYRYTDLAVTHYVYRTDNANARAIGVLPKWTVRNIATNKVTRVDTLAEAKAVIAAAK